FLILPFLFFILRLPPSSTVFPYTTLFRSTSSGIHHLAILPSRKPRISDLSPDSPGLSTTISSGRSSHLGCLTPITAASATLGWRSEEHTSELQSPDHLVCRLLLEKNKTIT